MRLSARVLGIAGLVALLSVPAQAQRLEPPATGGIVALDQLLRRLGHDKRVLVIGAHPDDEDTELLTVLTRGEGAAAAYLSLTRGEGGQNLIGPELGEPLGLLRTEELLAARGLDGARQYFTRAYDFGYSKNLEDTWAHWPRDSVLKDVVRVVRRFRPQVIVSIFSGTSRDGHGQHQAAGWAAHEAFSAAADSTRFPELAREEGLLPWQPLKLYRSTRFDTAATTLTVDGGVLDPAEGRTFHQIAMRSRSLHRSQDMGQLERIGPSRVRVALIDDRTGSGRGGIFAGVDTSLAGLEGFAALADSARSALGPLDLPRVRRVLGAAHEALPADRARTPAAGAPVIQRDEQRALVNAARAIAGEVVVDALSDDARIAAGESVRIELRAWNGSPDTVTVAPDLVTGWARHDGAPLEPRIVNPGEAAVWTTQLAVPADAPPTSPYFRRAAGSSLYELAPETDLQVRGLPAGPPPVLARFDVTPRRSGAYQMEREVAYRFNDQATGEVRRPIVIVPAIEVQVEPAAELWASGGSEARELRVTVVNASRDSVRGTLRLEVPTGWQAPPPLPFELEGGDDRRTFAMKLAPPTSVSPGTYRVRAVASVDRSRYSAAVAGFDYPHVRQRTWLVPAEVAVTTAPLTLPRLERVGYVRGAADAVPEALRSVGLPVEVLDAAALAGADLSTYDAIIVGPRAYEVDSALVSHNRRLLRYAEQGGLVIVQYQQHLFFNGGFAPYPMQLAERHDRVTDETAPVTTLEATHPVLTSPNRIGAADWSGWVQERGLYFARSWDERYTPLLSLHDRGEAALRGGLLIAPVGEGTWVYTGLSFFRQLPAGVPGAYRLFANLLALAERPDEASR